MTKWMVLLMALIAMQCVSALTFYDDFSNDNYTSEGWFGINWVGVPNGGTQEVNGYLTSLQGGNGAVIYQNFSERNMTFDRDFMIDLNFTKGFPNSLPPPDIWMVFHDGDTYFATTNYIQIELAGDVAGNVDLQMMCGGACSCAAVSAAGGTYDGRDYEGHLTYDKTTGLLNFTRTDVGGLNEVFVNSTISGCDISQFKTGFYYRQGQAPLTRTSKVYDFRLETCDNNWACSSLGACNGYYNRPCAAVTDLNNCGNPFLGNVSDYDVACPPSGTTSASHRGEVMYCDPRTEICYKSIEEAQGNAPFAAVPAGSAQNPLSAFFAWLGSLFARGTTWP
jgi:hypothetical protein